MSPTVQLKPAAPMSQALADLLGHHSIARHPHQAPRGGVFSFAHYDVSSRNAQSHDALYPNAVRPHSKGLCRVKVAVPQIDSRRPPDAMNERAAAIVNVCWLGLAIGCADKHPQRARPGAGRGCER